MLLFVAGSAANVFTADLAGVIDSALRGRFPQLNITHDEPYRSEAVEVIGWSRLQERAARTIDSSPQLSGIDAYQSVYVPLHLDGVERLPIPTVADPLEIGSLHALLDELRAFAAHASLPTDEVELMQLGAHYLEDDALIDKDLDVQTFVQLMLTAKQSAAHGLPLWIVVQ